MIKIKESFSIKVIAYILVLLLSVITAFSLIITFINADRQWYSYGKKAVMEDIYDRTAQYAADLIDSKITGEYGYNISDKENISNIGEVINGENEALGFGYVIKRNDYDNINPISQEQQDDIVRAVHEDLNNSNNVYVKNITHNEGTIEIYLGEITEDDIPTIIYTKYHVMDTIYKCRYVAIAVGSICAIIILCLIIFLMTTVGKKENDKSIIRKIPLEIVLAAVVIAFLFMGGINTAASFDENLDILCLIIVANVVITVSAVVGTCMAAALKMRQKNLWESSLTYKIYIFIKYIFLFLLKIVRSIPMVWKASLSMVVMLFICWVILMRWFGANIPPGWYIWAVILFILVVYISSGLKKLRDGARHFAKGDFSYHIGEEGMVWDMVGHARDLNSIGKGIAKAVEEKTKSERFKNELITNVSHDIKTPLTTIINYVDFLKKENIDNEKAREYIDVLDRQSKRLKKLTEDLIEASKAATGNIKLDMMPCQVGVLMTQTSGEYKEKLESKDLKLVTSFPKEDIEIMADGRSMWRIFDNILNNICKYSQPGTRVYQTLERENKKAVITYKNTSSYELNISEEELMERFVRGDSSRNTEGSGLGLSIAKNLVRLQGGSMEIIIDGDLFKVIIKFSEREKHDPQNKGEDAIDAGEY